MTTSKTTSVVRFEGSGAFASLVAEQLERAGASVDYEPPFEQRGAGQVALPVVEMVVAGLTVEGIKAALQHLRSTLRGRGQFPEMTVDQEDIGSEDDE